ncbi:MAG: conjugal transfer protein TraO [Rikenellaceae bacterium]
MRRALFIMVALVALCTTTASAQRYLPKMQGIELRGGVVDGFSDGGNCYFGVAHSTYTKSQDRWVIGAEYLQKGYDYKDITIPKAQFTVEGGYYLMFLSDPSKTFFVSIGGSALMGYETSNWGKKLLYDGATLRSEDSFISGAAVTLEVESYLTDKIVLLINARERVLWGSSIGHFHTQVGVGLKFIIN